MRAPSVLLIPAGHLGKTRDSLGADTLIRLKRGLRAWRKTPDATILVTGGLFRSPRIQIRPAADMMADWLIRNGVPDKAILRETASLDTFENIRNSLELLKRHGIATDGSNLAVVTEFQHALRFWLTFRLGYGLHVRCIPIWYIGSIPGCLLEIIALAHHLTDRRGTGWLARVVRAHRSRRTR